ncbi:MAG: TIGR03790 family protein [Gemmataceae bacterium]
MARVVSLVALLILTASAPALEPADVFVLYNSALPASKQVAQHYAAKRKVPAANLVGLPLPTTEEISRADYEARLLYPLRDELRDRKDRVKVLLTVYGVPLKVNDAPATAEDKAAAEKLKPQIEAAKKAGDAKKASQVEEEWARLTQDQSYAAVDNELMLLWWPRYPLARWVINPLYWQVPEAERAKRPPVTLVARLDAPTPELAKGLVDQAVQVEAAGGLKGTVYVDARGIRYEAKSPGDGTGYAGYDESFREAAAILKAGGRKVVLDDKSDLFPANSCPDAAVYCGWYALRGYKPSFKFNPGAVAWHLASLELTTLRDPKTTEWGANLLRAGAAVTIGPVNEPYTVGFPKPAEFFAALGAGTDTLVECYAKTTLLVSWRSVLIGDPLYRPFAKTPAAKPEDLQPSPKGFRVLAGEL